MFHDLELPWKPGRLRQHVSKRFGEDDRKCPRGGMIALIDHDLYPLPQLVA
jgi:hypothetical protein